MNLTFCRTRDTSGPMMEAALALYRSSFPAHELRLPPDQRDVMGDPRYHFDLCLLDGALAGLILYWNFGAYFYVEHFCVEPSLRGHGLGTKFFSSVRKEFPSARLRLEVEPENTGAVALYKRLGFTPLEYVSYVVEPDGADA